jgi:RNA polymerase sigma factor (TIGR02999 family)
VVNEVYLRLAGSRLAGIESRGQFFGIASRLIREVLVDYARARRADKRGGGAPRVGLDEADGPELLPTAAEPETLLAVHEALRRLERIDRRQSRVVELRYFAGLTQQEVADLMGLSLATVERDWMVARHWLAREIGGRAA